MYLAPPITALCDLRNSVWFCSIKSARESGFFGLLLPPSSPCGLQVKDNKQKREKRRQHLNLRSTALGPMPLSAKGLGNISSPVPRKGVSLCQG